MKRKDIYTEAWNITWKYKFLWVFGFVAGITLNTKSGTTDYLSSGAWLFQHLDTIITSNTGVATILMMGIGILMWLIGLIARADLIHGVARIVNIIKDDQISLKAIFLIGLGHLPKLAGMQIIVWLPLTILTIITAFQTPQLPITESSFFFLNFASISAIVVISFVVFLGLSFVDAFAFRLIVLESQSIISSIQQAGRIIRHNWGKILKTAIICGIIGLIVSIIIGIPLAPLIAFLMAPIVGPMQEAMRECMVNNTEFEAISECVQGIRTSVNTYVILLPASLIIAGFYSIWTTFLSTVFTLLYEEIAILNVLASSGRRKRGKAKAA
ncbi:MAG: hypothetical protein GY797_08440 [Deltaproteobacteria bacterium]|nr:hypothetical protein [Deltaproteobacteria bacterium]